MFCIHHLCQTIVILLMDSQTEYVFSITIKEGIRVISI